MIVEDHDLFEEAADIVQSEIINIEHVARVLLKLIDSLNGAAEGILPLFDKIQCKFVSKTIRSHLFLHDILHNDNTNEMDQLQRVRIKRLYSIFNEKDEIKHETITESNFDLIDAKIKLPENGVHYATIPHIPTLKEILAMADIDLIKPQNSMRLPTDTDDRHPLEDMLFEYTRLAEEISGMNKREQIKDIEAYCYVFLNEMIRNVTILFQNIFRVIIEYYASLDITYYRELNCTILLQALSGRLTPSEKLRLLQTKESIHNCYEVLGGKVWELRDKFPLFDSAYRKIGLEKHVSSSSDYREFLKTDLLTRHQITLDVCDEQLLAIINLIQMTYAKGEWTDLSDQRKQIMDTIIDRTKNFVYLLLPMIKEMRKVNDFYINSCLNIQNFAKRGLAETNNKTSTVGLTPQDTSFKKISANDLEESMLDEIEKLLFTVSTEQLINRQIYAIVKKYVDKTNHFIKEILDKCYSENKILTVLSLYLCRQRLPHFLFDEILTTTSQGNNLNSLNFSKINEKALHALCGYIIWNSKYLSIDNCHLSKWSQSQIKTLFYSIGKSKLISLSIKSNQLDQLNPELWHEFCLQLKNSKILRLEINNNNLDENKLFVLNGIIESNLRRYFVSRDQYGLRHIVSRFIWSNLGSRIDANHLFSRGLASHTKGKVNRSYLFNVLEEQERYGLKN